MSVTNPFEASVDDAPPQVTEEQFEEMLNELAQEDAGVGTDDPDNLADEADDDAWIDALEDSDTDESLPA